jgi:hypothetical protein
MKKNITWLFLGLVGVIYGVIIMSLELFLPEILVKTILTGFIIYTIVRLIKNRKSDKEKFEKLKIILNKSEINLNINQVIIVFFICLWLGSLIPLLVINSNYIEFISLYFLFVLTYLYFRAKKIL